MPSESRSLSLPSGETLQKLASLYLSHWVIDHYQSSCEAETATARNKSNGLKISNFKSDLPWYNVIVTSNNIICKIRKLKSWKIKIMKWKSWRLQGMCWRWVFKERTKKIFGIADQKVLTCPNDMSVVVSQSSMESFSLHASTARINQQPWNINSLFLSEMYEP